MPIRISNRAIYDSLLNTIFDAQVRVNGLQMQVADGRKLRVPSDDPVGSHLALQARERLSANEQYQRNLEGGLSHLDATDAVLIQIEDIFSTARAMQVSGSNDPLGEEGRNAMADQLDQMIRQVADLGNQRFAGTFLFGGAQSLTAPYELEINGRGVVVDVGRQGNTRSIDKAVVRQVDQEVFLSIHAEASDVFGEDQELFRGLIELRDSLRRGNRDQIAALGERLTESEDRLLSAHGVVGTLLQRGAALKEQLTRDQLSHESDRSRLEDADVAEALVELQQQEVALRAALEGGARVLNLSLLDYLS